MRVARVLVAGAATMLLLTGCAGYWRDRGRDAGDILGASIGPGIGATAQVGPAAAGLGVHLGLDGWEDGARVEGFGHAPGSFAGSLVIISTKYGSEGAADRGKAYRVDTLGVLPVGPAAGAMMPASYFTKVEVSVGFLASVKVAMNPGEILDFLLGFVGLDIYSDDLAARSATTAAPR
jgi:hypothetical protein